MGKSLMPTWILWLSPVVVAPLLAVVWTSYASRPRRPIEVAESVHNYERFRDAINAPVPAPRSPRPSRTKARSES